MSRNAVLGNRHQNSLEKNRVFRADVIACVDALPADAPRIHIDRPARVVLEEMVAVEDWLELNRPRYDRRPLRAVRRVIECEVG